MEMKWNIHLCGILGLVCFDWKLVPYKVSGERSMISIDSLFVDKLCLTSYRKI